MPERIYSRPNRKLLATITGFALGGIGISGCAGGMQETPQGREAGQTEPGLADLRATIEALEKRVGRQDVVPTPTPDYADLQATTVGRQAPVADVRPGSERPTSEPGGVVDYESLIGQELRRGDPRIPADVFKHLGDRRYVFFFHSGNRETVHVMEVNFVDRRMTPAELKGEYGLILNGAFYGSDNPLLALTDGNGKPRGGLNPVLNETFKFLGTGEQFVPLMVNDSVVVSGADFEVKVLGGAAPSVEADKRGRSIDYMVSIHHPEEGYLRGEPDQNMSARVSPSFPEVAPYINTYVTLVGENREQPGPIDSAWVVAQAARGLNENCGPGCEKFVYVAMSPYGEALVYIFEPANFNNGQPHVGFDGMTVTRVVMP